MGIYRNVTSKLCVDPAVAQFPPIFTKPPPRYDLAGLTLFLAFYVFIAMSIVCDEYFVPAVVAVCLKVGMTPDVVGATFMAATTSAPEFFVDMVATFITEGDIGIGTIVGSAVFNLLAIPGICGFTLLEPYKVDWWPITRDLVWYIFAIFLLTITVYDEKIVFHEAGTLFILITLNWGCLIYDKQIQMKLRGRTGVEFDNAAIEDEVDDDEAFEIFAWPRNTTFIQKIYWVLAWPCQFIYLLTIPNINRKWTKNCHWMELFFSAVWIMILSYMITWFLTVVGFYYDIPDSVMGLTILAAGTSVPEAVSSYIVTRKGSYFAAMAVCNSVSSNTFDIFVCLGLPWTLKIVFDPDSDDEHSILLDSSGLFYVVTMLLFSAAAVFMTFLLSHFTISRKFGVICFSLYLIFIVVSCLVETNVFGPFHKPPCPYHA